jgi:hypothetical protein
MIGENGIEYDASMEQCNSSLSVNCNDGEESKTEAQEFEVGIQLGIFIHS